MLGSQHHPPANTGNKLDRDRLLKTDSLKESIHLEVSPIVLETAITSTGGIPMNLFKSILFYFIRNH